MALTRGVMNASQSLLVHDGNSGSVHQENVAQGRRTVLDAYGATAHEEFFAVAVEVFFEKPERLRDEEPEVYGQLVEMFRLDPAGWE